MDLHAPQGCNSASFFRCFFGCVFGAILGRFWVPFWTHFRPKVLPKRLRKSTKNRHRKRIENWCQNCRKMNPKRVWNLCFSDTMLKMLNLLKHVFYCRNTMFFEGPAVRKMDETCKTHARNVCLKSVRKIHDIWIKNKPKKGHPKRPKAYIFRDIFACDFQYVFEVIFGSKTGPRWVQKGIQHVMKN